jgi:hypothetical protein
LNEWLAEFAECDVKIIVDKTEYVLGVGRFSYPITIQETSATQQIEYHPFRKSSFCTVLAIVASEDSSADIFYDTMNRVSGFCSNPIFGHLNSLKEPTAQYMWTNCICIFIEPEDFNKAIKGSQILTGGRLYRAAESTSALSFLNIQHFALKYKAVKPSSTNRPVDLRISGLEYLGRQGLLPVRWFIHCPNSSCRHDMENVVELKMDKSRNIISELWAEISPFENVDRVPPNNFTRKVRYTTPLLILPKNDAFDGLHEIMSARKYYLYYRHRINFMRMNQAIRLKAFPGIFQHSSNSHI